MDSAAAQKNFQDFLKIRNLRPTRERSLLLREIMRTKGHFDADTIFASLTRRGLKVSRATIYNNLDLLVQCGLISRTRFGENHSRYEQAFGRPRHDHLICLSCGNIIEFVNEKVDQLERDICREMEFSPENSTLQIFGRCARCSKGAKSSKDATHRRQRPIKQELYA